MTGLMTSQPSAETARAPQRTRPAPPPSAATSAAAPAEPLGCEIGRALRQAGVGPTDLRILGLAYALVTLLVAALCVAAHWSHDAAFQWGQRLLNLPLAAAGAGLLAVATLAAAAAVRLARTQRRRLTTAALGLAALGCLGFVATILMDYDVKWRYGVRPGDKFQPNERYAALRHGVRLPRGRNGAGPAPVLPAAVRAVDPEHGRKLFLGTCATCHGADARGLPNLGKGLLANAFVAEHTDAQLLEFLKVGRGPADPANTTKVQMPPRGGNPMLKDDDLRDIVAYVRALQTPPDSASAAGQPAAPASAPAGAGGESAVLVAGWVLTPPPAGPGGLSPAYLDDTMRPRWKAPSDGAQFAGAYYIATQFAGLHALGLGLAFIALLVQTLRRSTRPGDRASMALSAAGCTVTLLIWLVLAPFIYLL